MRYCEDLNELLNTPKYVQWIDGSFISTQINPKDIDMVSLIDYELIESYEGELQEFVTKEAKNQYGVDVYIVKMYPEDHKNHIRTKSDMIYWENWFGQTRRNRRKQRFAKGFVEIKFQ